MAVYLPTELLSSAGDGWSLSAVVSLRSRQPFTVTAGRDNNRDGNNNDRPNLIGDPKLDPDRPPAGVVGEWFNPQAVAQSA